MLTADFEVGHYIRERVVSRAVLLYTGEGLDEDDDDDYEEEVFTYVLLYILNILPTTVFKKRFICHFLYTICMEPMSIFYF